MYCTNCTCEFVGWVGRCPNCNTPLISEQPHDPTSRDKIIPYETLVDLVRENNGQLRIELSTTDVGIHKKWRFPYFAFGYAWAKRMQGVYQAICVDLHTSDFGKEMNYRFPYLGYGFAWAKCMDGDIGGNQVHLEARKVVRSRKWNFPYFGYGRAWTQEMSGDCGDRLMADLSTTEVGKSKRMRFPYLGYGFAWEKQGTLTLTLNE